MKVINAHLSQLSHRNWTSVAWDSIFLSSVDEWEGHRPTDLQGLCQMNWCHPHLQFWPLTIVDTGNIHVPFENISRKMDASFTMKSNTTPPAANVSLLPCVLLKGNSTVSQPWAKSTESPTMKALIDDLSRI